MHTYTPFDHNWLIMKLNNEQIRSRLELMTGVVYDLGCGTRPYEADIARHATRYVGVDWSNTMHGLRADTVADLNKPLPIDDSVADTVISFQVLEHLCEPLQFLCEAHRLLKPGGKIFIAVPFQWQIHEAPHDYFRYTRHGLEYLLNKAGFVDMQIDAISGFWAMWFLKFNYQSKKLVRGPRPIRWIARALLVPVWWLDQHLAGLLDRVWPGGEVETAGYFVSAHKT